MQSSTGRKVIRFVLALLCLCSSVQAQPTLKPEGATRWQLDAPWFGGWSGIEVGAQGNQMTVISDRGQLVTASLRRSNGNVTGIAVQKLVTLGNSNGRRLRKRDTDSEGLAIADDGRAFISFEHRHRIMQVDLANGRLSNRIGISFQNILGSNSGIEALAVSPHGTLYAVPEQAQPNGAPFPLMAYSNGQWRLAARIPQRGPFLPVGADFDHKGRLWLLERAVTAVGFRSRIRLFVIDPQAPREYTLLTTVPLQYDNLEGISVWQNPHGQLRVTLISDDNFLQLLRTQIVEFSVRE